MQHVVPRECTSSSVHAGLYQNEVKTTTGATCGLPEVQMSHIPAGSVPVTPTIHQHAHRIVGGRRPLTKYRCSLLDRLCLLQDEAQTNQQEEAFERLDGEL